MKDYYDIMGLQPDASDEEIKKMYHKLSKKYHPDANMDDPDLRKWSEERMKELNEAYDTLKDPLKRAAYDLRQRHTPVDPPRPQAAWSGRMTPWQQTYIWQTMIINAAIFGLFGLLRGGIPLAISGAIIGAIIGSIIANIKISRLPREVSTGIIMGMFIGALLLRFSLAGLILGGIIGGLTGWYIRGKG